MLSSSQRRQTSPKRKFDESEQSQEFQEDSWQALARIVRDVGPNLLAHDEMQDLHAAETAVDEKDDERREQLDQIQAELKALSRQLKMASLAAQRPVSHPTPAEHDAHVRALEAQHYGIGKQLNETQTALAKKEVELNEWRLQKEEVGRWQVGDEEKPAQYVDGQIIRLKLFADAGFSLIPPKDAQSVPKVLIRNDAKNDVHTVPIENARSKVHYANLIWSLASE
ncbi:hypothetical protein P7C73_g3639, partial [Tremellales sp. Uapishka_1]